MGLGPIRPETCGRESGGKTWSPRVGPTHPAPALRCGTLQLAPARPKISERLRAACLELPPFLFTKFPCWRSAPHVARILPVPLYQLSSLLLLVGGHRSHASWSLWGTEALGSHPAGFRLPNRMQLSAKPELSLCTFGISFFLGSPNEGDHVGSGATSGTQGCAFGALLQICFLRQKASAFCHEAIGFSSEI